MTKYQYYYEKEGKRINVGKKSRNDFKYVITEDHWNCGNPSFHTTYEKALKRLNWNIFYYLNRCENTKLVELQVEEIRG